MYNPNSNAYSFPNNSNQNPNQNAHASSSRLNNLSRIPSNYNVPSSISIASRQQHPPQVQRVPTHPVQPPQLPYTAQHPRTQSTSSSIAHTLPTSGPLDVMASYRARKDVQRVSVLSKYTILGFISSGTYGRVYKAELKEASFNGSGSAEEVVREAEGKSRGGFPGTGAAGGGSKGKAKEVSALTPSTSKAKQVFAIKKFKPDGKDPPPTIPNPTAPSLHPNPILSTSTSHINNNPNSTTTAPQQPVSTTIYTGISQSAIREISLNRELSEACRGGCLERGWGEGRAEGAITRRYQSILAEGIQKDSEDYWEYEDGDQSDRNDKAAEWVKDEREGEKRKERDHHFVRLMEVILEDKSIYMVFEYAEHDFLVSGSNHPWRCDGIPAPLP